MGGLIRERRGPAWKQGWRVQTLSSISPPPTPLLALFGIVLVFLFLSYYTGYRAHVYRMFIYLRLLLFLSPVILIFLLRIVNPSSCKWLIRLVCIKIPRLLWGRGRGSVRRTGGGSPWAVALLVVVLLVMVFFQSSFHSKWFRPLWRFY